MSVAENFFSAAKLLVATEDLKHTDEVVTRLADDVSGIDRRLVRLETIVGLEHQGRERTSRDRKKSLPGERA